MTVQQLADVLAWQINIGRGKSDVLLSPNDLCWGCDLQRMPAVAELSVFLPDDGAAYDPRRKAFYISARVTERIF